MSSGTPPPLCRQCSGSIHTAPAALDHLLDARGYRLADPSLTLHGRLDAWRVPDEVQGTLLSESLLGWLAHYCQLSDKLPEQQATHTASLQATPKSRIFATLSEREQAIACAVGVVFAQALSIVDVVPAPEYRQQGYGTALLGQLFAWAQQSGASDAALQVPADNVPARVLYARLGFREVYHCWYRVVP